MTEYLSIDKNKRLGITEKIKEIFLAEKGVVFAYVFGSFLDLPSFRDIDIGIYLDSIKKEEIDNFEMKLSGKISKKCEMPFDIFEVKVLNFAPNSFLNNIFRNGKLLFSHNEKLLSDLIEKTSLEAIDNEYFAHQSLKELIPA
ncbi:MAG: hypothetical protein A2174_01195 [Candidatus Portnoybacteria bacterium RBG_13_41_18]|uniref:Polymerase beta nucleotidyltransferase domain-containing protein n=1 Tax=Candidatus Portnoybacteria bacterium RBG_13_41_18 TaxID=1801991 RepID=A0A1G2F618_9BACT|nr:MAG: hypothetical protein A2174_01195 [Candidatus Portnoybacteria bacterium RBG_13_41_18]